MEPDIERMPFIIQRHIMDYRPRLLPIKNYRVLRKHLSHRYCASCGEYIDLLHQLDRPFPRHVHRGMKKFRPRRYKYLSVFPSMHLHLNHELVKTHGCVIYVYWNYTNEGLTLPFKILFLKKQVEYFYSFKKLIHDEYKKCVPMYNIHNINVFHNPDFVCIDNPDVFGYYDTQVVTELPMRRERFIDLFIMLKHNYIHNIEYYFFYYILQDEDVFRCLVEWNPYDVISVFDHYNLLCSSFFLKKLDTYPFILDYLSERKLKKIYDRNRSWFFDRWDRLVDYIELFCPLEETYDLRQV